MEHPETYLLRKVISNKENGLTTLGHLPAKHFKDISEVMALFATEAVLDFCERIKKGEAIEINNTVYSGTVKTSKPKKQKAT